MPSTYLSLHYHLVFSTEDRKPTISDLPRLRDYLAGIVLGLGGHCQAVGGMPDHVHLLVGLNAKHTLADFMRELKKSSSTWMHDVTGNRSFSWQKGYAAFTVSASARDEVRGYILNQAAHHRVRTFHEELKAFLDRSGVAYDERYLD
jgi:REP element-mobilizing transposase RayT